MNAIILQDSSTQKWSVTILDSGLLQSTTTGSGSVNSVTLNDPSNSASWQMGITTAGLLTTTSVTFSGSNPKFVDLVSSTLETDWHIGVTLAGLLTSQEIGTVTIVGEFFTVSVQN